MTRAKSNSKDSTANLGFGRQRDIRRALIGLVDCMVALPGQLTFSTN